MSEPEIPMTTSCGHAHEITGIEHVRVDGRVLSVLADLLDVVVELACQRGLLVEPDGPMSPDVES